MKRYTIALFLVLNFTNPPRYFKMNSIKFMRKVLGCSKTRLLRVYRTLVLSIFTGGQTAFWIYAVLLSLLMFLYFVLLEFITIPFKYRLLSIALFSYLYVLLVFNYFAIDGITVFEIVYSFICTVIVFFIYLSPKPPPYQEQSSDDEDSNPDYDYVRNEPFHSLLSDTDTLESLESEYADSDGVTNEDVLSEFVRNSLSGDYRSYSDSESDDEGSECDTRDDEIPPIYPDELFYSLYHDCNVCYGVIPDGVPSASEMFETRVDLAFEGEEDRINLFDTSLSLDDFQPPEKRMSEQSGEFTTAVQESFKQFRKSYPELASNFTHIEDIMILIVALANVKNATGALSVLTMYVKTLSPKIREDGAVISLLEKIIEMPMQPQSGGLETEELPLWIKELKSGKANWSLLRNNPLFAKISTVCSLLVSLGLCSAADINFTVGGFQLFSQAIIPKHSSAFDLFDAVTDTFIYFIEGGWRCYATGSIAPLILGDDEIVSLVERITKCENFARLYKNGNITEEHGVLFDENKLESLFVDTIQQCNELIRTTESTTLKRLLLDKKTRLQTCHSDFSETRLKGGLRMAPYCVGYHGRSCKGKSYLAAVTMGVILRCNHFAYADRNLTTLNANDQFWSTYRSDTSGVFIDDIGNENPDYCKVNPTRILIDLVNNVRIYANKAEIEAKGRVTVEPRVVVTTKNKKDGQAGVYSVEPVSITRREKVIAHVECKPSVMTDGKLDPLKAKQMKQKCGMDDLWRLTLETSYGENFNGGEHDKVAYKVIKDPRTGRSLKDISLADALDYMIYDSRAWFVEQRKLVARSTEVTNHLEWCDKCNRPGAICECSSIYEELNPDYEEMSNAPQNDEESVMSEWTYEDNNVYMDEQSGIVESLLWGVISRFVDKWWLWFTGWLPLIFQEVDALTSRECATFLKQLENSFWFRWTNYIPEHWLKVDIVKRLIYNQSSAKVWFEECWDVFLQYFLALLFLYWCGLFPPMTIANVVWFLAVVWTVDTVHKSHVVNETYEGVIWDAGICIILWFVAIVAGMCSKSMLVICFSFVVAIYFKRMRQTCEDKLIARIDRDRAALPWVFSTYREKYVEGITALCFAAGAIYCAAKVYKSYNRKVIEAQSDLNPADDEEINVVDAKAGLMQRVAQDFNWTGQVVEEDYDCAKCCSTVSQKQLVDMVFANLCHIRGEYTTTVTDENGVEKEEKRTVRNQAFFPCSNVCILPYHLLQQHPRLEYQFIRNTTDVVGANFKQIVDINAAVQIPHTDLALVYVDRGGSWKDLSKYFPNTSPKHFRGLFLHKNPDGSVYQCETTPQEKEIVTNCRSYDGYAYKLKCYTKCGLCISPILGVGKKRIIAGFHLAGYNGTVSGAAGKLTLKELQDAMRALNDLPGVLLSTSRTEKPATVYQEQYLLTEEMHPKSPLRNLEDAHVRFSGSVKGRCTFRSSTKKTIISDTVADVTGFQNEWKQPPVKEANPWVTTLKHLANPTLGVEFATLRHAVVDFTDQLKSIMVRVPKLVKSTVKLTRIEMVSGRDGQRFIDSINWNSAINYNISGKKERIKIDLDPDDYPEHECPRDLPDWIWDRCDEIEECYLNGESAYEIFQACLKDEPVHVSKTKVRVFQACPIALMLLLRKYFLPIGRFMSLFPLESECAVGINPHGPDWHNLRKHITKFGVDNTLAGDYATYDLRMPSQLTLASFDAMIEVARSTGNYSDRDIKIMQGLASDVCYPKVAYDGDLLELFGSNPSGHSLTVYVNCIANSLLFRCGFFHIYPETIGKVRFKDACALITYGDDAKSSVSGLYPKFNHITYAEYLLNRGIVFTMPDKTSKPTAYMSADSADFLKNQDVWMPELERYMAALSEKSIFKSLHFTGSSVLSDEAQAVSNIDGAIREWFSHGREVYELRRSQMREVAETHGLSGWCTQLDVTFDDAVANWKTTYLSES